MLQAAERGAIVPPADIRFLRSGIRSQGPDPVVGRIVSFLQTLYDSVAETLPDMRSDPGCETEIVELAGVDDDPYAQAMQSKAKQTTIKPNAKPRAFRSLKKLDPATMVVQEDRWLPPGGHMKDYWEQMNLEQTPVSFSQFWRVPVAAF